MNLLPKSKSDFREKSYWDSFFKKRGQKAFEWYGEYGELCGILHKYIRPKDSLLVVGCGNSKLSSDLYDVGYTDQVSIDVSSKVIDQMKRQRPEMKFCLQDVTDMKGFADDGSFNVALDKGTLDAMFTDESDADNVDKMFAELDRVLKLGGRYVTITLLQPHILEHIVPYFSDRGWPVRIVRCKEADINKSPEDRRFPVFAFIATKFRKMAAGQQSILEFALSSDSAPSRLTAPADLVSSVKGIQQFAAVRAGLAKDAAGGGGFNADARQNGNASLDLVDGQGAVRYSMYLAESASTAAKKRPFGVFIVPQGREAEWLFCTVEGRVQICESAGCQRLVVVHLHRNQVYESLDQVKAELSSNVMELAPPDLPPSNDAVPIMSVGGGEGPDSVGTRSERCRGNSELSGEFVVEDVSVNGDWFRRLIFLHNTNLVQSEAKLKLVKGGKKRILDLTYLCSKYHSYMIGALGAFKGQKAKVLIIGLGGGGLAAYIAAKFPKVHLDIVELDPAIVRVAKDQFGFQESDRVKVMVQDGLEFVSKRSAEPVTSSSSYDVIMIDVDSKDVTVGMSCPPKPFVEPQFLNNAKSCLTENGTFVLNFTCRDSALKSEVIGDLRKVFGCAASYSIPEYVNSVVFCSKKSKDDVIKGFKTINTNLNEELIDLKEAMKNLSTL